MPGATTPRNGRPTLDDAVTVDDPSTIDGRSRPTSRSSSTTVHDQRLVFLDSAASSQKPTAVLAAMDHYYETTHANVHRAAYTLAEAATNAMEGARAKVARFIGATVPNEIVFTKNATESLNLVARSWGGANLGAGDAIVLTQLEHHANIVPWHQLAAERGIEIRWIPLTDDGKLDLDRPRPPAGRAPSCWASRPCRTSSAPSLRPRHLADAAHAAGALVCVDACQYVPHVATDVAGPSARLPGVLRATRCSDRPVSACCGPGPELLEAMPPFLGGGGMILDVTLDGFIPADVPHKFEAGTPPIAEIVGLGAAIDYLDRLGMDRVRAHEIEMNGYALRSLTERFGERLTIYGPQEPGERGGVMSIAFDGIHPHDLSQVLDQHGVCVRPGHHCAKPLMRVLGVGATARASWYVYNDRSDIDELADALEDAGEFFAF